MIRNVEKLQGGVIRKMAACLIAVMDERDAAWTRQGIFQTALQRIVNTSPDKTAVNIAREAVAAAREIDKAGGPQ